MYKQWLMNKVDNLIGKYRYLLHSSPLYPMVKKNHVIVHITSPRNELMDILTENKYDCG